MRYITATLLAVFVLCLGACAEMPNQTSNNNSHRTTQYSNIKGKSVLARVTGFWARGKGSDYNTRRHNGAWIGYGKLKEGHCAVDPRKIPYGSKILYSDGTVDQAVDTGSAVVSRKAARLSGRTIEEKAALVVDKFFETKARAIAWANKNPMFMFVQIIP